MTQLQKLHGLLCSTEFSSHTVENGDKAAFLPLQNVCHAEVGSCFSRRISIMIANDALIYIESGILNGSVRLLSYQVAGSSSRPLPNWLLTKVDEMTGLALLDRTFPGGSPTASGKHIKWDVPFIRVDPANDHLRTTSE